MSQETWIAIVLAAGQGTRMKSSLPKVLHRIAGRPMIHYVVETALSAGAERVIAVVGHGREHVESALSESFRSNVSTALQPRQNGTGDAVRCGIGSLGDYDGWIVVLYGDVPLLRKETLDALLSRAEESGAVLAMITGVLDDPTGYGRIVRDEEGNISCVREHRDCSEEELDIVEVNPGIYAIKAEFLRHGLERISSHNAQGELYLTDLVGEAARAGGVASIEWTMSELRGVNDRFELAGADRAMQLRILRSHCLAGVTIRHPESVSIDADVTLGKNVVIEANVTLRGRTKLESDVVVDVGCVLDDATAGVGARLKPYCVVSNSSIGAGACVGPFAHLRPGSSLGEGAHIGNFVETKNTTIGKGSKANHLAYLGDGVVGDGVNIGAGTIFCNYDGAQKHTTVIEDGAFIGSDSQLVAPLTIGKGAYVATGTTLTKDVPDEALAIGRVKTEIKEGYAPKLRARLKASRD